ncbi:TonB-dependent receptor [Campylobacter sp. 9BO]|uniref:TonB-dependent receptor domain-containing protein n=1 Tax=Campylobacter sp. 9BO TaxID=3424759 RepID=UPI003D32739E
MSDIKMASHSYNKANKKVMLYIFVASTITTFAADNDVLLDSIEVIEKGEQDVKERKVGEIKKTAKDLEKQQVSDSRDLVKYETGISVVESGRFGASGYSIRGVDENRVAIQIDGLKQAETISSQGFKELFEGYGNFNNTRNGIEMENVKSANITKGADSIKAGSGALGGSVMFETKDARDYLIDKDWHYGFKVGHSSANDERMHSHTLAARFKWFDFLVIKTDREGHETKNYGYSTYDDNIRGRTREKADPYNITKQGTLIKVGFQPHDEHRFSFANDVYKSKNQGNDYSYTLYPPSSGSGFQFDPKKGEKYTDDLSERISRSFTYENFTQTPFWDNVKITYSHQKITQRARSDERCLEGDNCQDIANKAGLKVNNSNIVDRYGKDFEVTKETVEGGTAKLSTITDSSGQKYQREIKAEDINNYHLDCSVFDCSGTLNLYKMGWSDVHSLKLDLSKTTQIINADSNEYVFDISEYENNGKKFKQIQAQKQFKNYLGHTIKNNTTDISIILPNSKGFLENLWKERDLNTQTKQLNFDFEKEFEIFSLENNLKYGALYGKTEKSMINRTGYYGESAKWWASNGKADCGAGGKDAWDGLKCPRTDPETSFLIPVESKNGMIYFADKMRATEWLEFDFGYRYDRVKYNPNYIPGVTPKIPDDMVKGIFIPLEKNKLQKPEYPEAPRWWSSGAGWTCDNSSCADPAYLAAMAEFNTKKAQYDAQKAAYEAEENRVKTQNEKNPEKNIEYLSRPKEFSSDSYSFGINFDPFDFLRIQTKYSKAFRAPTTDELYLTFRHPDMTIVPNVDLKPEIAKTKEIAFTFHNNSSFLTLSTFRSDYTNFIDFTFIGRKQFNVTGTNQDSALDFDIYQNINRQEAKVNGFEINSRLNLGDANEKLKGFYIGYKLTKQKGRIQTKEDGKVPMNAIQPKTSVYSLGYATQNDKYGADVYITDVKAKKSQDTYNMFWKSEKGETIGGKKVSNYHSHWLSDKYTTIDIVAFARPVKNLTFRLGAYNLTDKKYITWESARSIRSFGTTNMVRKSDNLGINRFYAPGRNFKLTFEMTF